MTRNSDIDLNAYVDGELTSQERVRVLEAIQQYRALAREVCELNNLKSQLQLAYANPPGIAACKVARASRHWLMLAVGLLGGWLVGNESQRRRTGWWYSTRRDAARHRLRLTARRRASSST
ncbi:anti-sigma factor family protein [endosymbiont of unidentified scaly snail isolate Monju]|uniref:anti-sigma factor family protein n=1 Tax=endosymbiont of unidentified scaly snail isolate Monju TaxID=1248727 RepID=UPI0014942944|nr:hypothetical protein [endosymbiont of unidentified scaly snail isolate Monju]